jgi:uncharacterized protein YodC (DUF2158 family)
MKQIDCFFEGMLVRQKSGGPPMWVVSINDDYPCNDNTVGGVFCTWEEDQTLYEHIFSPYALDILFNKIAVPISKERRLHSRNL